MSFTLDSVQSSATLNLQQFSFNGGRTLRVQGLPVGVSARVDASAKTLTYAADFSKVKAGTSTHTVDYLNADGSVRTGATITLTIALPAPIPAPAPAPVPVDPDQGKVLSGGLLSLSPSQLTATIDASQLSFSAGRTLRILNLPQGVASVVDTGRKSLTLTLDPARATTSSSTVTLQYLTPDGTVLLSANYTLNVTAAVIDVDQGKTLPGGLLSLSVDRPSATIDASALSFSAGRTLRLLGLPAGVSSTVNTSARSLTVALDAAHAAAGTSNLTLEYVTAEGQTLLRANYTLTVTLPPADPDQGKTLLSGSLSLSAAQPTTTLNFSQLSFSAGRTVRLLGLPTGISAVTNVAARTTTLTLDAATASSGTSTITAQYVDSSGAVLLSAPYSLTVTLPAPTPVPAPPPSGSGYQFTLVFTPGTDARLVSAAQAAAARWEKIITSSIGSRTVSLAAQDCGNTTAYSATVKDIVIFVGTQAIDGANGVLAESGPCLISGSNRLPVAAQLIFDTSDLNSLSAQLPTIAMHEFGHALGIGSLWNLQNLLQGSGTSDPRYTGANGKREYAALGGTLGLVPVENSGGQGTAGGHWREKTFGNELMTGYLNSGSNPLSRLSIAALEDLGYSVSYASADPYSVNTLNTLAIGMQIDDRIQRPVIKMLP